MLDRLMRAFRQYYIGYNASGTDHRFNFGRRGATIYIRPSSLDIARIRHGGLANGYFPNSDRLLDYAEDERNGVYRHITRGRDEYQFRAQHADDLIRILRGD